MAELLHASQLLLPALAIQLAIIIAGVNICVSMCTYINLKEIIKVKIDSGHTLKHTIV